MGVHTTSDEAMDQMKERIEDAYKCFLKATHPDTWGSDEWKPGYTRKVRDLLEQLREVTGEK